MSEILKREYSEKFDQLRKNRVETSYFKYGPAKDNFSTGNVKAIHSMERCIRKYQETGNTEFLLDGANYLMFEFMYPLHPKAHFRATSSEESAGIDGLSVNEAKKFMEENKCF